ncbi:hypothetical protein AUJ17_04115 [Candidatus Micrarchaeota archaeon CG1_02_47_40]|nr:MAG: hypothetical protein AUJ17_04115 [Candidatus Micrarchaeota archaeon CG1_02_47_40]QBM01421.1 hypothetical protein [uncultured archaeon]
MKKITIAGAGPSGLCAAISLARAGLQVQVQEKEKNAGTRWVGSFQCLENTSCDEDFLEMLERIGIKKDFYCKPLYGVEVIDGKGASHPFSSARPLWYLIRRGNEKGMLDYSLKKQAIKTGVKLKFGTQAKDANILATGPSFAEGIAREMVFETNAKDQFLLLLDNTIAPKGYAYLLIADKTATLCVAIMKDFSGINKYFELARSKLAQISPFNVKNPKYKTNFVSFHIPSSAKRDSSLYVGEAAGFQDFVFGFGLRYAFLSGYLAAKSIIDGSDYDSLWKKEFASRLELGILNRALYEFGGDSAFANLISQAEKEKDFGKFLHSLSKPTLAKGFLTPFAKHLLGRNNSCNHAANCAWRPKKR